MLFLSKNNFSFVLLINIVFIVSLRYNIIILFQGNLEERRQNIMSLAKIILKIIAIAVNVIILAIEIIENLHK
jgi:hypothetical protein